MLRTYGRRSTKDAVDTTSWLTLLLVAGVLGGFVGLSGFSAVVFAASEVDLVVNPPPSLAQRTAHARIKPRDVRDIVVEVERGGSLQVEATISNVGTTVSGPFDVRIFLADRYDGSGLVHEFDIVRKLAVPAKGQASVNGEYVIPFYPVVAGRSYWLVLEADTHNDVAEGNEENNREVISTVFVPCDDFQAEEYVDEYLCPNVFEND